MTVGATDHSGAMSILDCFDVALATVPDKDFLRFREGSATYHEFDATYRRLAARLAGAGIAAGDIVPACFPNSEAAVATWFALTHLGAVWTSMNVYMVPEHVRFLPSLPRTATGKVAKAELKDVHGGAAAPL